MNGGTAINKELSAEEFTELRDFVYQKSGMYFPVNRKSFLEKIVLRRLQLLSLADFPSYLRTLRLETQPQELLALFNDVTINETYFFRDQPQLDALRAEVLPSLAAAGKKRINLLSAGCSSGEEPFTLSIIMREYFPQLDFSILGLDISSRMIDLAKQARYGDYAVRFVPERLLNKYFIPEDKNRVLRPEFRDRVRFQQMNLLDLETRLAGNAFDIIFCRYVLIYFDLESKRRVVETMHKLLNPGGYLVLGNSEALFMVTGAFKLLHLPSAIIYRKES